MSQENEVARFLESDPYPIMQKPDPGWVAGIAVPRSDSRSRSW
jgi:hypothetical protein